MGGGVGARVRDAALQHSTGRHHCHWSPGGLRKREAMDYGCPVVGGHGVGRCRALPHRPQRRHLSRGAGADVEPGHVHARISRRAASGARCTVLHRCDRCRAGALPLGHRAGAPLRDDRPQHPPRRRGLQRRHRGRLRPTALGAGYGVDGRHGEGEASTNLDHLHFGHDGSRRCGRVGGCAGDVAGLHPTRPADQRPQPVGSHGLVRAWIEVGARLPHLRLDGLQRHAAEPAGLRRGDACLAPGKTLAGGCSALRLRESDAKPKQHCRSRHISRDGTPGRGSERQFARQLGWPGQPWPRGRHGAGDEGDKHGPGHRHVQCAGAEARPGQGAAGGATEEQLGARRGDLQIAHGSS
mmetsp:Transcript_60069/g.196119  ORF Transcript_60069/g.196119 Transcript_60069/m.196119 type:complete len:354 (+) Transcript_60069:1586-2647(+)